MFTEASHKYPAERHSDETLYLLPWAIQSAEIPTYNFCALAGRSRTLHVMSSKA